jgi:hypothetical protein
MKNPILAQTKVVKFCKNIIISCLLIGSASAVTPESGLYGHSAAQADTKLTITTMLTYAIQDEYMARAEYLNIMNKFGAVRPFSNISNAESRHIALLENAFNSYKLTIPSDEGAKYARATDSLQASYQMGVASEVNNIAMYNRFLTESAVNNSSAASIKQLFITLRDASQRHLAAFKRFSN